MVFFPGEVGGTFVWFCLPTPLVQVWGGGGGGCLENPGVFQNGVEKIESIIRFSNPDVEISLPMYSIETTLLSRAQLFERRLALTRGKILTRVPVSLHQKDSLG